MSQDGISTIPAAASQRVELPRVLTLRDLVLFNIVAVFVAIGGVVYWRGRR